MSDSPLVCKRILSPNCNSPRNHKIDMVVIHCMAGPMSIEGCGACFAPVSRQASSNYGVGSDGRIAQYVLERDRSWCTCSPGIDNRAITIEVANIETVEPFRITEQAYNALINLLVDICRRNSIPSLKWKANKTLALSAERGGSVEEQNMVVHRWFEAKSCPGNYLYSIHGQIASEVNRRLANKTPITGLPQGVVVEQAASASPSTTAASTSTSSGRRLQIDASKIHPYLVTPSRNATNIDYNKLKACGVIGSMLDAGYAYTSNHVKVSKFESTSLKKQIDQVRKAGLPFALYSTMRARSVSEAEIEMQEFRTVLRRYPPTIGVWLQLQLPSNRTVNDKIMEIYLKCLVELGFKSQIGLYVTPTQLKSITWSQHKGSWLLWLIDAVSSVSDLNSMLEPKFFDTSGRYV